MSRRPTALVALSGGVDSSVAAALVKRRGYDVVGITMQIWQESQTDPRHAGCCSLGAVEDARRVARLLDIPHYVVNLREEFRETVIDTFVDEYAQGRTPNPCVECNRKVKFEALFQKLDELGCDVLVTGHYARVRRSPSGYRLLRARAAEKDQSYVLYMLDQERLARTRFPLGELPGKAEARQIARDLGLPVADKPDSQEICFVSEAGGYAEFLRKHRPEAMLPGPIVDEEGQVLGSHQGAPGFTIGQRRGLGVSHPSGRPMYVLRLDPASREVVVGEADALSTTDIWVDRMAWPLGEVSTPQPVVAKVRSTMPPARATLFPGERAMLRFDAPVKAVAPGQIAVAYRGQTVLAGGVIGAAR